MNPMVTIGVLSGLAIATLAMYRSGHVSGTLPFWVKQLKHPDRQVRLRTVHQLGQLGTPQAAYCLALVAQSDDQDVKQLAIKGLLNARQATSVPVLTMASSEREPKIRRMIAQGITGFADPMVTQLLVDMLRDPDESVVAAAVTSLGQLRDVTAAGALAHSLEAGEDTARLATQSLLEIGKPAFEELCRLLPTLLPIGCERLLPVLIALDPAEALDPLVHLLNTTDHPFLLKATISAIAGLKTHAARHALVAFVSDERHACRPFALGTLQASDDEEVTGLLLRLLSDQEAHIRRAAAETLGKGYDTAWIGPLLTALSDEDQEVFRLVSEALGQYEDPRILQRLFEVLWPEDYDAISRMVEDACRKPLSQLQSVDELIPVLRRISSKEARGNEEQRIRHPLQSVVILLRPQAVCGFQDLTNTILVFKHHDFNSEYQLDRLHPHARRVLRMQPNLKALHLWRTSLR